MLLPAAPIAWVDLAVRSVAVAAVAFTGLVAATHWAVRRGHLGAFGFWPRLVRKGSDPLLRPLEKRLVSMGRNPQDAGLWLFAGALLGGLLLIVLIRWITGMIGYVSVLSTQGPVAWIRFLISAVSALLMGAIVVRVLGSWLGAHRWNRLMRPFYLATDWIIQPIKRRMPAFGPLDLSPLIAYLLLLAARTLLLLIIR
ncbi:MAG: YggT family protein [Gemmatimonadales bacterium]